jgi:hypothetical protein
MLYQLPNGKAVEMSVEQFLDLTDEDFQFLMCLNAGDVVEDPFFGTAMGSNIPMTIIQEIAEQDMSEEIEDIDESIDFSEEE